MTLKSCLPRQQNIERAYISNVNEIPTACGGLIPTHKILIKNNEFYKQLYKQEL